MFKRQLAYAFSFCAVLIGVKANAQNLCPPGIKSDKLICMISQVYGVNGLVLKNTGTGLVPFQNILPDNLSPLNAAAARGSALLPLASPSSTLTYTWDAADKVYVQSNDSFGPVFGERAETIGKYKTSLGVNYQHFRFSRIDGLDVKNLPAVFTQPDDSGAVLGITCSINPPNTPANEGDCGFIRDVIHTNTRIDLTIHQATTFLTFGVTNRLDVSVAIPIQNVRMGVFSTGTIVNLSMTGFHQFASKDCGSICTTASFSNVGTASGIGDIILRAKGTTWKRERAALAAGLDVRIPTGDAQNFLGTGTVGVKPFVVWSYRTRIAPHVVVGFETNGNSILAGNISTGSKDRFPDQLTYAAGADMWITKSLTWTVDLLGQQVFQASRVSVAGVTEPAGCKDSFCGSCPSLPPGSCSSTFFTANKTPSIIHGTETYNASSVSVGVKMRPFSSLLMTGNVLLKLNEGGLRYTAAPLIGVSYLF